MMEITRRDVSYRYGDKFTLKPLFDVHIGSPACDERAFKSYLEDADDECTYLIGGGDLLDAVIASDAKRYRKSSDASGGDAILDEQVDRAHSLLWPYKERILGLATGNHEDVIVQRCSTDLIQRLCRRLEVPFLGYSGLFKIQFRTSEGGGRTVVIRYHHGWASGRTPGGQLTSNVKDVLNWDADVYLYGHGHALHTYSIPRLGLCGDKLISKDLCICLCGTFLKTYTQGSTTYSERKGYPPISVGSPRIFIKPHRRGTIIKART
jgi:hypothetical protein